jgi:hypothetical protein
MQHVPKEKDQGEAFKTAVYWTHNVLSAINSVQHVPSASECRPNAKDIETLPTSFF